MEQQFIAVTEKAPRLELLEAGQAQKFLVLYDSYVHRNILGGATVAMASCLEKDDLLQLLEETENGRRCSNRVTCGRGPETR